MTKLSFSAAFDRQERQLTKTFIDSKTIILSLSYSTNFECDLQKLHIIPFCFDIFTYNIVVIAVYVIHDEVT